jgi:hypothetical protein
MLENEGPLCQENKFDFKKKEKNGKYNLKVIPLRIMNPSSKAGFPSPGLFYEPNFLHSKILKTRLPNLNICYIFAINSST